MYAYILHPNLVVGDISISFNDFLYPVRHGLHQFFQVWRANILVPPLLDGVLWVLFCIGQDIPEASLRHLHLFPDLFERDVGLPELNCCSLLSLRERFHSRWHACGRLGQRENSSRIYMPAKRKVFVLGQ